MQRQCFVLDSISAKVSNRQQGSSEDCNPASAVKSGIDILPLVIAMVFGSIVSGQIIGLFGYCTTLLVVVSSVLMHIAAVLITAFTVITTS